LSIRPTCVAFAQPVIVGKHDVIHKTGSTQHIAALAEEDEKATATINTHRLEVDGKLVGERLRRARTHERADKSKT